MVSCCSGGLAVRRAAAWSYRAVLLTANPVFTARYALNICIYFDVFTARYVLNIYIYLEDLGECLLRGTCRISIFTSRILERVCCAVRAEYLYLLRGPWRVFTAQYVLNIYIYLEDLGECLLRGTCWISTFTSRNLESVYCAVRAEYLYLPLGTWRVFTARYVLNIYIYLEEPGESLLRGTCWISIFTSRNLESVYCEVRAEYLYLLRGTWRFFTARYVLNIYIYLEEPGECLLRGTCWISIFNLEEIGDYLLRGTEWIFSFTSTTGKLAGRTVAAVVSPQARVRFSSVLVRFLVDRVLLG
jgi:hypothetical protein